MSHSPCSSVSISVFSRDLQSNVDSLNANSAYVGSLRALALANPYLASSLLAWQSTVGPDFLTAPPPLFTQLPSPYDSLLLSVWSGWAAIASRDGIITDGHFVTAAGSPSAAPSSVGADSWPDPTPAPPPSAVLNVDTVTVLEALSSVRGLSAPDILTGPTLTLTGASPTAEARSDPSIASGNRDGGGLSRSDVIAIAVGTVVPIFCLLATGAWYHWRKKRTETAPG